MATKTSIVNLALLRIGVQQTLANVDTDGTREALSALVVFDLERDRVLRDFPWGWASKYATLDVLAGSPSSPVSVTDANLVPSSQVNGDWIYAYKYPDDAVFVRRIVSPVRLAPFPSFGRPRGYQSSGDVPWPPAFKVGGSINMGLQQRVWRETPTSLNSALTDYRLANLPIPASELVFVNEHLQHPGVHYTIRGTDLTFRTPLVAGQRLRVFYWITGVVATEYPLFRERPAGIIDGANKAFTLASTPVTGSELVFLNELYQEPGTGYTISGSTITMTVAPAGLDRLRVFYYTSGTPSATTAVETYEAALDSAGPVQLPSAPIPGSEMVFLNEYLQELYVHYTLDAGVITWVIPPAAGSHLRVCWNVASDVSGLKVLYTNELNPTVEYTAKVTDPSLWDAEFASMLAWRLAAALALGLSRMKDMAETCLKWYQIEKTTAEARTLNEAQAAPPLESEWIRGR